MCASNKSIDFATVKLVHEHRNGPAFNNVYAPTRWSNSGVREIADRNSKPGSVVELSLHNALIVGGDPGHGAGLQREHVRIDNFPGKFRLIVVTAKPVTHIPQYDRDEK